MRALYIILCLALAAPLAAQNRLSLTSASGSPGEEVTISAVLENAEAVTALQLELPLDENVSFVDGSCALSERAEDHSVSAAVRDGRLRLIVYSPTLSPLRATDGELFTFRLLLDREPKTVTLTPSRLQLTGTNGSVLDAETTSGAVTTWSAKAVYSTESVDYGRVPIRSRYQQAFTIRNEGNIPLVVEGVDFSAPAFSTAQTFPLTIEAGGAERLTVDYAPLRRGTVQERVHVRSNTVMRRNDIALLARPFAVNELHVEDAAGVSDEEVTVRLRVNNMDTLQGFQVDFPLPAQLRYVEGSFALSSRAGDHATTAYVRDDTLRLAAWSLTGDSFSDDDGELASFRLLLCGRYGTTLRASKVSLSANVEGALLEVTSASYAGYVSIRSPQISGGNSVGMGSIPITKTSAYDYTIRNYGSAPLRIERIVFNREGYEAESIELPLVVEAGESAVLPLRNTLTTAGDIGGTMQLYCNDPDLRMKVVSLTGDRYSPNFLTLCGDTATTDGLLLLPVVLSNHETVCGAQLELDYPIDALRFSAEKSQGLGRFEGVQFSAGRTAEGRERVMVFGVDDIAAQPDTAAVMLLAFEPVAKEVRGTYRIGISSIKLAGEHLQDVHSKGGVQEAQARLVLRHDVNDDGNIDISDLIATANHILGNHPAPFFFPAADANDDGEIDVTDIIATANKILE